MKNLLFEEVTIFSRNNEAEDKYRETFVKNLNEISLKSEEQEQTAQEILNDI